MADLPRFLFVQSVIFHRYFPVAKRTCQKLGGTTQGEFGIIGGDNFYQINIGV